MTRREEIYEASCECYNDYIDVVNVNADAAQDAFIKGAEWADKTMIEKACEWLYVYYPTLEKSKSAEDAWDKFKKAMEE